MHVDYALWAGARVTVRGAQNDLRDWQAGLAPLCVRVDYCCRHLDDAEIAWRDVKVCVPLVCAAARGDVDVVRRLLREHDVEPNANESAALRIACHYDRYCVVDALLHDGRSVPTCGAMQSAAYNGNARMVQLLDRFGRFEQRDYDEILLEACLCNTPPTFCDQCSVDVVDYLLRATTANPNAGRDQQSSALSRAMAFGCTRIVRRLLADPRLDLSEPYDWAGFAHVDAGAVHLVMNDARCNALAVEAAVRQAYGVQGDAVWTDIAGHDVFGDDQT